jgi:hypothetical protein
MNKHQVALGIILGIAAAAANAAEVDGASGDYDYKQYSAAGCGAATHTTANVWRTGAIFNTGTAVNDITCPVVLDRSSNNTKEYYLTVFRASGAGTMTCYLTTQSWGSVTTTTRTVSRRGADSTLYFSSNGYPSSASLGCGVPAKLAGGASGIKHYSVYEY